MPDDMPNFQEPKIEEPKQAPIIATNQSSDEIQSILAQLVNLNPDNIFHEPTCVICNSTYRKDVEKMWKKSPVVSEIQDFIKSKNNSQIASEIIENHMKFHTSSIRELQKVEYINKIKRASSVELTTLDRISLGFATLSERLSAINSLVPDNNTSATEIEVLKTSETVKINKAFSDLIKLQASLMGELKNNNALIVLPRDPFIQIFNETLLECENDSQKNIIETILNKLLNLSKLTQ